MVYSGSATSLLRVLYELWKKTDSDYLKREIENIISDMAKEIFVKNDEQQ